MSIYGAKTLRRMTENENFLNLFIFLWVFTWQRK